MMASMNGVNSTIRSEPAGKGRHSPSSFARNNLSKGGVNNMPKEKNVMGKKMPLQKGKWSK